MIKTICMECVHLMELKGVVDGEPHGYWCPRMDDEADPLFSADECEKYQNEEYNEETIGNYSSEDIIIDLEDPRLEGAIGKDVFFSNDMRHVLLKANLGVDAMPLEDVYDNEPGPFRANGYNYRCIIIK